MTNHSGACVFEYRPALQFLRQRSEQQITSVQSCCDFFRQVKGFPPTLQDLDNFLTATRLSLALLNFRSDIGGTNIVACFQRRFSLLQSRKRNT